MLLYWSDELRSASACPPSRSGSFTFLALAATGQVTFTTTDGTTATVRLAA